MSDKEKAKIEHWGKFGANPGTKPGVSRQQRNSDEGLQRLKKQLECGVRVSDTVLQQWIKRYGDDARVIIEQYKLKRDG